MATYSPVYPPAYTPSYCKANNNPSTIPLAFNPALSVTGSMAGTSWTGLSASGSLKLALYPAQGRQPIPARLYIENGHSSGTLTTRGARVVHVYGTDSYAAFINTDYANTDDLTLLATVEVAQHVASDIADPQYFALPGSTGYRYFVLRIESNWGDTDTTVRHIEIQEDLEVKPVEPNYEPVYPPAFSTTYCKATTANYPAHNAFDPALPLTGTSVNGWVANLPNSLKLNVDYGVAVAPTRLYIENGHSDGNQGNRGVRIVHVYGTDSSTAFANTTYANTDDLALLTTIEVPQHVPEDRVDPLYFPLPGSTGYRYFVFRIESNWGDSWLLLRHIEMQVALVGPERIKAVLEQMYGDAYQRVAVLEQTYGDAYLLMTLWEQLWGLRMGADLLQPYGDAPVRTAALFQPWGDAGQLKRALVQRWQDAIPLTGELEQRWHLPAGIVAALNQPWSILGELASGLLVQGWDLRDVEAVRAVLQQSWSLADDGELLQYSLDVYCEGQLLGVSLCNIEASREEDSLSCEIHLARERDYLACAVGAELVVIVGIGATVEEYVFRVTSPRIEERHGEALYIIEALSPAAYLLGAPWAAGIDMELSGTAASIAATLAGDVIIDWQTVDWHIPAATWIAAGETPLDLLRRLADAVGAVVQSLPDGSLLVEPDYRYAVPGWSQSAADGVLVETLDCFSSGDSHDPRPGYNRYLVGDQMTAADGLRLEEEALSASLKIVRGYQIPWDGAFALTHTGGDWVQIEAMGIEERQETEVIELVGGAGRTRYPIYSRDAVTWMQTNLGSVTVSEDGAVQADIEGQSLLELTYTTRCRRWRVRNPRNEQLQLVAEV